MMLRLFFALSGFLTMTINSQAATLNFAQIQDLVTGFKSQAKPVLFVFCREDRAFHCLSIIRASNGELLRTADGKVWSLPMLAKSIEGRSYNERRGNTPQGVLTYNGVMPIADNFKDYGSFRRVILNFIPSEPSDLGTLELLPESSRALNWWREASVARDLGRSELRIHGVGKLNSNPNSFEYPFVPTWGCLTTREGVYEGAQYQDQRVLLDALMVAQQLSPTFDHEPLIQGYVVLLNLNGAHSNVEIADLEQ